MSFGIGGKHNVSGLGGRGGCHWSGELDILEVNLEHARIAHGMPAEIVVAVGLWFNGQSDDLGVAAFAAYFGGRQQLRNHGACSRSRAHSHGVALGVHGAVARDAVAEFVGLACLKRESRRNKPVVGGFGAVVVYVAAIVGREPPYSAVVVYVDYCVPVRIVGVAVGGGIRRCDCSYTGADCRCFRFIARIYGLDLVVEFQVSVRNLHGFVEPGFGDTFADSHTVADYGICNGFRVDVGSVG